ncbi:CHAD domain-containing protein [Kineococcus radiotolerans]|uniref:CHAD domain-containing protein n=1 Tax=Kineococcus radiotolerans TaxID=131568 RepID=A0A7W4XXZ2_KINRA|nr:CYTH and CHAD domain-containing protein [Kineococcus radiotolerans]MBB2901740.1 CHAD domain-containing protein [Kineococcus radiotolerans]
MVSTHEEIEVKYELEPGLDLPALPALLRALPEAAERGYREGDLGEFDLEATYFDTVDLRLSAARTTLRRRTGGTDAGWHLKTPGEAGARVEQRLPLGRAVRTVPAALRRLVEELTGGSPLVPVARVNTHRSVRSVLDATGTRLLELADDVVEAHRLLPLDGAGEAAGAVQTWREVELEIVEGDRAVFEAVDAGLRAAGLRVSSSSSKLSRVLSGGTGAPEATEPVETPGAVETAEPTETTEPAGASDSAEAPAASEPAVEEQTAPTRAESGPRVLEHAGPRRKQLTARSRAGDVLVVHLAEQVQQVLDQDPRVRSDEPDSIHKMRVATRRLRSALRTFQPLLARSTKPLRDELRWLAAELGAARDAEVLRDRLVRSVATLDVAPELQPADPAAAGAVPALVADQLGRAYRTAHDRVLAELDSERYQSLLDDLQDLVERPRFTSRGARRADKVLPRRVAKTFETLSGLVEHAYRAEAGAERDELLHEARKAAKQVRYAAEAVAVVFGKDATRFARAVTDAQEVLGEHQDSVVTRQQLRDLAASARPEVAFAYGRLFAQEEAHAAASEADFEETWKSLQAGRLHRWLR